MDRSLRSQRAAECLRYCLSRYRARPAHPTIPVMFSEDHPLAVAYDLLDRSTALAFRADAFLCKIDEIHRRCQRRSWELDDLSRQLCGRQSDVGSARGR
jgi:hypothetical protein